MSNLKNAQNLYFEVINQGSYLQAIKKCFAVSCKQDSSDVRANKDYGIIKPYKISEKNLITFWETIKEFVFLSITKNSGKF